MRERDDMRREGAERRWNEGGQSWQRHSGSDMFAGRPYDEGDQRPGYDAGYDPSGGYDQREFPGSRGQRYAQGGHRVGRSAGQPYGPGAQGYGSGPGWSGYGTPQGYGPGGHYGDYGQGQEYRGGYGSDSGFGRTGTARDYGSRGGPYGGGFTQGSGDGEGTGYGEGGGYAQGAPGGDAYGGSDEPGYPGDAPGGYRSGTGYARTAYASGQGRGPYGGRGPRGYRRSDDRIREEVCDRLTEHDRVDASDIEVQVAGGVVTLNGTVDDRRQKRVAEDVVEQCAGVQDVANNIRVRQDKGVLQQIGDAITGADDPSQRSSSAGVTGRSAGARDRTTDRT